MTFAFTAVFVVTLSQAVETVDLNRHLHDAVSNDALKGAAALLAEGADPNSTVDGQTPLWLAAKAGNARMMELLLRAGANPRLPITERRQTPLSAAVYEGHARAVEILLKAGADPHSAVTAGRGQLHNVLWGWKDAPPGGAIGIAVDEVAGRAAIVKVMPGLPAEKAGLRAGDTISQLQNAAGHWVDAANKTLGEVVAGLRGPAGELLRLRITRKDERGQAIALTKEIERVGSPIVPRLGGHEGIMELLLDAGVDVNRPDKWGFTPSFYAAEFGAFELLRKLIVGGADIRIPSKDGGTPLMIAAQYGHAGVAILLVEAGANPYRSRGTDNKNALFFAALGGHANVIDGLARVGFRAATPESTRRQLANAMATLETAKTFDDLVEVGKSIRAAWEETPSAPEVNWIAANFTIEYERSFKHQCKCGLKMNRDAIEEGLRYMQLYAMLSADARERSRALRYIEQWRKQIKTLFPDA